MICNFILQNWNKSWELRPLLLIRLMHCFNRYFIFSYNLLSMLIDIEYTILYEYYQNDEHVEMRYTVCVLNIVYLE